MNAEWKNLLIQYHAAKDDKVRAELAARMVHLKREWNR